MELIEEYKGYEIHAEQDTDAVNPIKEWGTLGTFACFHGHYDLSNTDEYGNADELYEFLKSTPCVTLDLRLYDHSGLTISTAPFSCPWDSRQVGRVYVFIRIAQIIVSMETSERP